jgi:hypothetical protein
VILNPAIIALEFDSLLMTAFTGYATVNAIQILRNWDMQSGSEGQLQLERKTYLISTILAYVMGFEIISLILFTYTTEHIHDLFVGAMCAAGSLNVNDYGYPTLVLKGLNCILCGQWLIVNYTDNMAPDYPLIRAKYKLLLIIFPSLLLESFFQMQYFLRMKPDVITSCCGLLFSEGDYTLASDIAALPPYATKIIFFVSLAITIRIGIHFLWTGKAAGIFSLATTCLMILSLLSIISFIAPYFYALPTHHCPFCLLQKEYHYIGYPLYFSLLTGCIAGLGVGVLDYFQPSSSLLDLVPALQKRLCLISIIGYVLFAAISVYPILFSDFKLEGY